MGWYCVLLFYPVICLLFCCVSRVRLGSVCCALNEILGCFPSSPGASHAPCEFACCLSATLSAFHLLVRPCARILIDVHFHLEVMVVEAWCFGQRISLMIAAL